MEKQQFAGNNPKLTRNAFQNLTYYKEASKYDVQGKIDNRIFWQ